MICVFVFLCVCGCFVRDCVTCVSCVFLWVWFVVCVLWCVFVWCGVCVCAWYSVCVCVL